MVNVEGKTHVPSSSSKEDGSKCGRVSVYKGSSPEQHLSAVALLKQKTQSSGDQSLYKTGSSKCMLSRSSMQVVFGFFPGEQKECGRVPRVRRAGGMTGPASRVIALSLSVSRL